MWRPNTNPDPDGYCRADPGETRSAQDRRLRRCLHQTRRGQGTRCAERVLRTSAVTRSVIAIRSIPPIPWRPDHKGRAANQVLPVCSGPTAA